MAPLNSLDDLIEAMVDPHELSTYTSRFDWLRTNLILSDDAAQSLISQVPPRAKFSLTTGDSERAIHTSRSEEGGPVVSTYQWHDGGFVNGYWPEEEPAATCKLCGLEFVSRFGWSYHCCKEHFLCPAYACDDVFHSDDDLCEHKVTEHCICGDCDMSYPKRKLLAEHVSARHKARVHRCPSRGCNMSFVDRYSLILHRRQHVS